MSAARDYVDDIVEAARKIDRYTADLEYDEFIDDELTVDAVLRNFEVMVRQPIMSPRTCVMNTTKYPGQKWLECAIS